MGVRTIGKEWLPQHRLVLVCPIRIDARIVKGADVFFIAVQSARDNMANLA